ncbi:MAG: hypothetical protein DMG83_08250 [Acidobacteria bacterium]|nr:MAG: hypothetical protein DMG83_08250 [Acidobacteriota bacterium]
MPRLLGATSIFIVHLASERPNKNAWEITHELTNVSIQKFVADYRSTPQTLGVTRATAAVRERIHHYGPERRDLLL